MVTLGQFDFSFFQEVQIFVLASNFTVIGLAAIAVTKIFTQKITANFRLISTKLAECNPTLWTVY